MSSSKCARCEQTVYPVEGLRCLDKIWHKGCFKCQECNMTLSLKNYKGFEKKPYCNAHCPQAKATTVADTPEIRRLAENTRIQSQAKYHEDFERSKGKGFTAIADDPETLRIKNTSKIISNVAYHGELERKKQMEEKRTLGGPDEVYNNNNNNDNNHGGKHQNMMMHTNHKPNFTQDDREFSHISGGRPGSYPNQNVYHIQSQQQQQIQLQQHQKQQQQILKQQQMLYAQDLNNQSVANRQHVDGSAQQLQAKQIMQQYPIGHPQHQQFIMRQQQQHQLMLQQQRQSLQDANLLMNHQAAKQSNNISGNNQLQQQQMIKNHIIPASQLPSHQMKYLPMNDGPAHQASPTHHIMGGAHLVNSSPLPGGLVNQRAPNSAVSINGSQGGGSQHHMTNNYGHHLMNNNGVMPKQSQQQYVSAQPHLQQRHAIHPGQMQPVNNHHHHQMRSHAHQMHPHQQQVPRRVFRAIYDYVANDVDEVSFFENDILIDCVNVDGNWLIGKVARSGQTGMLPANYVTEFSSQ